MKHTSQELLDYRHRDLLLLQNPPMKRRQVCGCPENGIEVLLFEVQNKPKVLMNLAKQLVGEDEATVSLVLTNRLQNVQHFLKTILQLIVPCWQR